MTTIQRLILTITAIFAVCLLCGHDYDGHFTLAAETTTLYRAVSPAELESINASGGFSNPLGTEVKYFSTSAEGAASYAQQAYQAGGSLYQGPYTIISTEAPASLLNNPLLNATVDRGIGTVTVPSEMLPGLGAPQALPATPIPPSLQFIGR